MSKLTWVMRMVMTWPSTAIQRNWMSCRRFCRPVPSSLDVLSSMSMSMPDAITSAVFVFMIYLRTTPLKVFETADKHRRAGDHQRQHIPGYCVDQVIVAKRHNRQTRYRPDAWH